MANIFYRLQIVKAFVTLTDSYKNENKEKLTFELQQHTKEVTAPYKYPRKVLSTCNTLGSWFYPLNALQTVLTWLGLMECGL